MRIYVARHGETNYNVLGLCNDNPEVDVHLTSLGKIQAQNLGEHLRKITFNLIYVSELKRTQQTGAIVNQFFNLELNIDSRLNDNKSGFEGKSAADFINALHKCGDSWDAHFNDGESLNEVRTRVHEFIDEVKLADVEPILIITSRMIVQMFHGIVNHLKDEEYWDLAVDKGSVIELTI